MNEVIVQVYTPEGEALADCLVELNDLPCSDDGGGKYTCLTPDDGQHDLFVLDANAAFSAYAERLELEEPECEGSPMLVTVDLLAPMGM